MEIEQLYSKPDSTLKEVMKLLDTTGVSTSFILNGDNCLVGVVTNGDIRRAIFRNGKSLDTPIKEIMNKHPFTFKDKVNQKVVDDILSSSKISKGESMFVPVVDKYNHIKDILLVTYKGEVERYWDGFKEIKRILVIGGAGYLGSILCRKLLDKGYKVRVLDNLIYGSDSISSLYTNENFEFQKGDIRNIDDIVKSIRNVDAVVHLAAIVGDKASELNPEDSIEINYLATKLIAEVCKYGQINKFIFTSSCSVYGDIGNKHINERSITRPISLYAKMKLKSEEALMEIKDDNFMPTILRLSTLFGLSPRMRFDLAINILTASAIKNKEFNIYGGEQWRPFLHVEDAAEAITLCLESDINKIGNHIFNVGSENLQMRDVGKIIQETIPNSIMNIKEIKDERNYNVDFSKIKRIIGFKPKRSIKDGIKEIMISMIVDGLYSDYMNKKYSNADFLKEAYDTF